MSKKFGDSDSAKALIRFEAERALGQGHSLRSCITIDVSARRLTHLFRTLTSSKQPYRSKFRHRQGDIDPASRPRDMLHKVSNELKTSGALSWRAIAWRQAHTWAVCESWSSGFPSQSTSSKPTQWIRPTRFSGWPASPVLTLQSSRRRSSRVRRLAPVCGRRSKNLKKITRSWQIISTSRIALPVRSKCVTSSSSRSPTRSVTMRCSELKGTKNAAESTATSSASYKQKMTGRSICARCRN